MADCFRDTGSPSPAFGRNQDLFSRQDAKSAKEEGRTEDRRSANPQTFAILASWREAKSPSSCLRPGPGAFIALPGAGGERSNSGPSLRQLRRYPITRRTHSFVRSQGFVCEQPMVRPDADLRVLFSSCEITAQDEHGYLLENVPDTVTFP